METARYILLAMMILPVSASRALAQSGAVDMRYSFGPKPVAGYTQVTSADNYSIAHGFGFDLGSQIQFIDRGGAEPMSSGFVTGKNGKPFFFSARLGPGVYRVTLTLGDSAGESTTTVKSETRRLMLEAAHTLSGKLQTQSFLVHVRVPQIPGGGMVAFKDREKLPILYVQWDDKTRVPFTELDWDEKLTLEFSESHSALCGLEITPAANATTVYLVGDSTMTDQMMEPWGAWGQWLPRWFKEPVVIANYAECGETTASFISEHRWQKVMSEIRPGDYVFMQFGINDQRLPVARFKQYFLQFIDETKKHGANPVLVTSQNLKRLDADGKAVQTLRDFPQAMRDAAREQNVPLIDLNAMSMTLYQAIGADNLTKYFFADSGTHHTDYGSYELCKCVVDGIIEKKLGFGQYLADDWKPFDPSQPDAVTDFKIPPDPQLDPARPGGPGAPDGRGPMAGAIQAARGRPATQSSR